MLPGQSTSKKSKKEDETKQPITSGAGPNSPITPKRSVLCKPKLDDWPSMKPEKSVHFTLDNKAALNATDSYTCAEERELRVHFPDPAVESKPTTTTSRLMWSRSRVNEDKFDIDTVYMVEDIVNEIVQTALTNTSDDVVDGLVNEAIDQSVELTAEGIASDIVDEIINSANTHDDEDEVEIYCEEYKASGRVIQYLSKGTSLRTTNSLPYMPLTSKKRFIKLFKQVFLPYGFPESVSADYAEYQTWDTLQAFFSSLTGALTTHAIMTGVGVGDAKATAASAAITWIMRDGTGMIGRILFAWWKGTEFDTHCKKWRLFADILNDVAMFLECLIPHVSHSLYILFVSTAMKSLVGVAGGATRAALTQHQAIQRNMADVSAKDGSQESCVNLIASFTGILLLMTVADGRFKWDFFFFFVFCHIMCNYRAVRAVQMASLNTARFLLIMRCYLVLKSVGSVKAINRNESVFIGRGLGVFKLCGYHINLGASVTDVRVSGRKLAQLRKFYKNYMYMLYVDVPTRTIQVFLKRSVKSFDVIQAFYHAILLGIGMCMKDDEYLFIIGRQLRSVRNSPLDFMIDDIVDPYYASNRTDKVMNTVGRVVDYDFPIFFEELKRKGWDTKTLLFDVDKWRGSW